jgi:hypothetical protein
MTYTLTVEVPDQADPVQAQQALEHAVRVAEINVRTAGGFPATCGGRVLAVVRA